MIKKHKKVSFSKVTMGVFMFALVTFFTYTLMQGVYNLLNIDSNGWVKLLIGFVGLIFVSIIGWWKYK